MRTSSQSHSFSVLYFWIFSQHSGIMLGHGHTQRSAPQAHGRRGRWLRRHTTPQALRRGLRALEGGHGGEGVNSGAGSGDGGRGAGAGAYFFNCFLPLGAFVGLFKVDIRSFTI